MSDTNGARQCSHTGCGVDAQLLRASADGGLWCFAHDPSEDAERERDVARKRGGRVTGRRTKRGLDPDDLPPLDSPQAAARWAEIIGRATATGLLSASAAQSALRAVSEWRAAYAAGEMAERLERLESHARSRTRVAR
jgi:hypothetical protein